MKLTLKDIEDLVRVIIGEDVIPLIKILFNKENISEFKLAEMLNITVNQIRNMLYRMYEQNLVVYIRKKDKKKGWYIYYWSLNNKGIENAILKTKLKQLDDLKIRISREQDSQFFVCPNGCMRFPIETAMEYEFRCQECGSLMKELDNKKTIDNIKGMISNLEKEIEDIKNPPVVKKERVEKKPTKEVKKIKKKIPQKKPVKKIFKKIISKIKKKKI
jgi:transcription initiation factor TFIIE subunit alpha